ncbi:acyl-coenzyme A diphosphatase NUDT19-like [Oppia nitens]|uniref:acyl-coenzyme A diphosphatase NUDT19-like n=1 Tax=Oppia nitens TaxID=1686743 RepID=UPI0023DA7193|nr:acyl-coenzyme A diphosphatase NUDT19-like [Oppia nitens]
MNNYWKESVNIILVSPTLTSIDGSVKCDYDVLTIGGTASAGSLQSASYVLPGGQLDASDFSYNWWQLFDRLGVSSTSLDSFSASVSQRPPIITENLLVDELKRCSSNSEEVLVDTDIALRICAIRHVFQQTGLLLVNYLRILLVHRKSHKYVDKNQTIEYRKRVTQSPQLFPEMCETFDLLPDLWSLNEWWNWLTPSSVGRSPRFDTMYYLCALDSQQPSMSGQLWSSPVTLLNNRHNGHYILSPIHVYELSRLLNFETIVGLKEFARKRQIEGVQRWQPILTMYTDGAIATLPGDDYYPTRVEVFADKQAQSYSLSLREMRAKSCRLNRIELMGTNSDVVVNIDMPSKHIRPVCQYYERHTICANL